MEDNTHIKKTLHSKRSFGKHPRSIDSPAYDASEEDNDPLTDDSASHSISSPPTRAPATAQQKRQSRSSIAKHHLAASTTLSDDGVDSPTYDGDIESSTTAGGGEPIGGPPTHHRSTHLHHAYTSSTTSTLSPHSPTTSFAPAPPAPTVTGQTNQSTPNDTNTSTPTTETDLSFPPHLSSLPPPPSFLSQPSISITEPTPPALVRDTFDPAKLTPSDIQAWVRAAIDATDGSGRKYKINQPPVGRPIRIYADGVYDLFHFGHALQLRQAKLSFPDVYLMVGVCSDELVKEHKSRSIMSHAERLESVRHCRWVDTLIPTAPWILTPDFLSQHEIDYVAHDEEPYAGGGADDVYGFVKDAGKFLPTRRTPGISTSSLLERIVAGYRKTYWDKKLEKMGAVRLMAGGSDYEDRDEEGESA
ncbi:hypothetical protein JAAARDRAFT_38138 [Jaapia argillacea MUCL 33604]|uniref:choline-phosphate cytidylyltransferase n=1 Tax=Jaapia argillacea MUCL 33604 TaxID=933084 RepID=A0A067PI77_9AGAM|nr:hypothetical protein JAAARDRAFT_38138 [Jaapia argillacea MUCL 33604]